MSEEDFKNNVRTYIDVLRNEKRLSKELSDLRGHKRKMKEALADWMARQDLEHLEVNDLASLTRVPRKRVQTLKRQAVEQWAQQVLGGDERGLQEVGKLYDARDVKHVEDLLVQPV